jgi:hypothetical protein
LKLYQASEVRFRQDGTEYVLRPQSKQGSPLGVPPVEADVDAEAIVAAVLERREPSRSAT